MYYLFNYSLSLYKNQPLKKSLGDVKSSEFFWGDLCKKYIKYVRNFTFNDINTLKCDPIMPWHDNKKEFVKYWFSSSDGSDLESFLKLTSSSNLDKLEYEKGACIVYTHFANNFIDENGELNPDFIERIDDIAARNIWFVPVNILLDYLLENNNKYNIRYKDKLFLTIKWFLDKLTRTL